jgi:hypothetical protein
LWKKTKERPETDDIRRILENQLVGLDISEAALKLAALSLYLTAIELDPEPQPPDKLRFKNLRGHVLHDVREPGAKKEGLALGSLSAHLGTKFDGQFDVVVSNPPWTSVDKALGKQMEEVCQTVIGGIDGARGKEYKLPDNNPDLTFLWKATEWCRKGGRIAMALPARILLKTKPIPSAARATLFSLLQVDGIVNGTNLSDTPVWPHMNQPWMLLYATNKRPGLRHSTYFVTLPLDLSLNKVGQFRIDSESSRSVDVALATEKPWLWKALSVGTMLDVEVIEKMKAAGGEPLDTYWKRIVGKHRAGKGYRIAESQAKLRDCTFLRGLRNLNSTKLFRFITDIDQLGTFTRSRIERPRKSTIYDPPLILVKESPGEARENGRALLAFKRLAFNESFNGYSAAGHPDGEHLVRYLHLFVHSDIWLYYVLVTSSQFGAERRRIHIADLEKFPILPFEKLTPEQRQEVTSLSRSLEVGTAVPWGQIDVFFARLYGLKEHDLQVIRDTLSVALPYETSRQRACAPPTEAEKKAFVAALKKTLTPFVANGHGKLVAERWKSPTSGSHIASPFDVLVLTSNGRTPKDVGAIADGVLQKIINFADETGATQIVLPDAAGLVVGTYNQYRYWTPSRARLLSGDIIRHYLDSITG